MAATYTVGTGKTYSTIQAAVDAVPGNLAGQGLQDIQVFAGGVANYYNENVDANTGFSNSSAADYVQIRAMVPHNGKSQAAGGTGIRAGAGSIVRIVNLFDYFRFIGFEVGGGLSYASGTTVGINPRANGLVDKCIVHDITETTASLSYCIGIQISGANATIRNCLLFDLYAVGTHATSYVNGILINNYTGVSVINNTIRNCNHSANKIAYGIRNLAASAVIENNGVFDTTTTGTKADFLWEGTEAGSQTDSNCSSDATADDRGGTGCLVNKTSANQFISTADGSEDFRLKATADMKSAGVNYSGTFTDDIRGLTRSAWDIGAFRFDASAGHSVLGGTRLGVMVGVL